jgi:hypothetical protein
MYYFTEAGITFLSEDKFPRQMPNKELALRIIQNLKARKDMSDMTDAIDAISGGSIAVGPPKRDVPRGKVTMHPSQPLLRIRKLSK